MTAIGAIVIGRNEGERLKRCLQSLSNHFRPIVYVDSGSSDGSIEHARSFGVEVIELDTMHGFSAARARNTGLDRLCECYPAIELVQFVDGDCSMIDTWPQQASMLMDERPDAAVVCGRTKEVDRSVTIYNRLCDMEFDLKTGDVSWCGGIFLSRVEALAEVGGFDQTMIAGEEPELCLRLRRAGWKIIRVDKPMVWHDSAITHFGQWWKRSVRSGSAFAEAIHRHGKSTERHGVRETLSIWLWTVGSLIPILALAPLTSGWSLVLLVTYPLQALRITTHRQLYRGDCFGDALIYGIFTMVGKWAQIQGQVRYIWNQLNDRHGELIEYK